MGKGLQIVSSQAASFMKSHGKNTARMTDRTVCQSSLSGIQPLQKSRGWEDKEHSDKWFCY